MEANLLKQIRRARDAMETLRPTIAGDATPALREAAEALSAALLLPEIKAAGPFQASGNGHMIQLV
jgi:hypothetical protein